jgi:hypothetical protein
MLNTVEAAVASVKEFEEKRKAEGYREDTETVLKRVSFMAYDGEHGIHFEVKAGVDDGGKKTPDGKRIGWRGNGTWEASTERGGVFVGATPEEAIASLVKGVAQLAYDGHMDPANPEQMGASPVQHCMNVLSRHLGWHMARRQDALRDRDAEAQKLGDFRGASFMDPERAEKAASARAVAAHNFAPLIGGHNEAIAAIGTAISALARIKDL